MCVFARNRADLNVTALKEKKCGNRQKSPFYKRKLIIIITIIHFLIIAIIIEVMSLILIIIITFINITMVTFITITIFILVLFLFIRCVYKHACLPEPQQ